MNYEKMNARRIPVSGLFTGLVFLLVGTLCFVDIYYSYFIGTAPIESKIIIGVTVLLILFGIGCFVPSIRDIGFHYYISVYKKMDAARKKAKEEGKAFKYPGKWQNFIYQTFRNGSVAEECSESWRKLKQRKSSPYNFLEDCENEQKAVDKHRDIATKMALKKTEIGVSKMYHDCEKYQCLDVGFLLFSVLAILLIVVNIYLKYFKNYDFSITQPPIFGVLFYALRKLCKGKGKELAHRYLIVINSGWKEIEEEERRRREEEERRRKEEEERRRREEEERRRKEEEERRRREEEERRRKEEEERRRREEEERRRKEEEERRRREEEARKKKEINVNIIGSNNDVNIKGDINVDNSNGDQNGDNNTINKNINLCVQT